MKVTVASCVKGVSPGTQINFQNHMLRCCHFSEEMMMMFCETTLFFSSHCFFLYDNRELDQKKKNKMNHHSITTTSLLLSFLFSHWRLHVRSLLVSLDSQTRLGSKCCRDVLSFIQLIFIPNIVPEN